MRYDQEFAERQTAELNALLRAWKAKEGSDSVRIQNLRKRELSLGRRMMTGLVDWQPLDQHFQLIIGCEAVEGVTFSKGAYDTYSMRTKKLEPGQELHLSHHREVYEIDSPELYVGRLTYVTLPTIAETLRQGGQLAIVAASDALTSSGR